MYHYYGYLFLATYTHKLKRKCFIFFVCESRSLHMWALSTRALICFLQSSLVHTYMLFHLNTHNKYECVCMCDQVDITKLSNNSACKFTVDLWWMKERSFPRILCAFECKIIFYCLFWIAHFLKFEYYTFLKCALSIPDTTLPGWFLFSRNILSVKLLITWNVQK